MAHGAHASPADATAAHAYVRRFRVRCAVHACRRGAHPTWALLPSRSPRPRYGPDGRWSDGAELPMNGTSGADDPYVASARALVRRSDRARSLFVRAIYGYDGSSTGSLSFQKGDIIEVITKLERCGVERRTSVG